MRTRQHILDQSIGQESKLVRHLHTEGEINELRQQFTEVEFKKFDEEEQLAAIRRDFKSRIDPLKEKLKEIRTELRNRFIDEEHECDKVPNFDTGMMEYYSTKTGELVEERKLRPDERQLNILKSNAA